MQNIKLCAFADEADATLDGQIGCLRDNGIGYLEVRGVDGKNISEFTPNEARRLRERLTENGIAVWAVGSPIGKISIRDDFGAHFDQFKRTLEIAVITEARMMRVFSFYCEGEALAHRETVMERLCRLTEAAAGSGVLLCHENEKDIFGDTAERCRDICVSVPGIRAVFDPANFVQCGGDPLAAWEMLKDYTEYLHIKDADHDGANVPAGTGAGCLPEIIGRYCERGQRVLSLEPHLWSFTGLAELERNGAKHVKNQAKTQRAAFDLGVASLRKILERLSFPV